MGNASDQPSNTITTLRLCVYEAGNIYGEARKESTIQGILKDIIRPEQAIGIDCCCVLAIAVNTWYLLLKQMDDSKYFQHLEKQLASKTQNNLLWNGSVSSHPLEEHHSKYLPTQAVCLPNIFIYCFRIRQPLGNQKVSHRQKLFVSKWVIKHSFVSPITPD